jgi:glycerol-3-phosphate dehydrogenase
MYLKDDLKERQTAPLTCQLTKAEVLHSVREEIAQKLADVILRRTGLGSAGWPGEACVQVCAGIIATELGWDQARIRREINEVRAIYAPIN